MVSQRFFLCNQNRTIPDLNDPNNPWVLTKQYHQISEDGNIINPPFLIEKPDENTNLFSNFPNSLLAMYLFLTGNNIKKR